MKEKTKYCLFGIMFWVVVALAGLATYLWIVEK